MAHATTRNAKRNRYVNKYKSKDGLKQAFIKLGERKRRAEETMLQTEMRQASGGQYQQQTLIAKFAPTSEWAKRLGKRAAQDKKRLRTKLLRDNPERYPILSRELPPRKTLVQAMQDKRKAAS